MWEKEKRGAQGEYDNNKANCILQLVQAIQNLSESETVSLKYVKVVVGNNEKNFSPVTHKQRGFGWVCLFSCLSFVNCSIWMKMTLVQGCIVFLKSLLWHLA